MALMEKRQVTKAALARELGVSHVHVLNWLNGQSPRIEQFSSIARFFNVSMEWLLNGLGPSTRFEAFLGMLDQLKSVALDIYPADEDQVRAADLHDRLVAAVQPVLDLLYGEQDGTYAAETEWRQRAEAAEKIVAKVRQALET